MHFPSVFSIFHEIFLDKISEGQKVEMYLDLASGDKSAAQLAKVHACIRELAKESGTTFNEMKNIIKKEAGFEDKSFADCSKDELMFAIEACIDLGKNYFNLFFDEFYEKSMYPEVFQKQKYFEVKYGNNKVK